MEFIEMSRFGSKIIARIHYPINTKSLSDYSETHKLYVDGKDVFVNILIGGFSPLISKEYSSPDAMAVKFYSAAYINDNEAFFSGPVMFGEAFEDEADNQRLFQAIQMLNDSWSGKNMIEIEEKNNRMKEIEEEYAEPLGCTLEELFRRKYVDEYKSPKDIANELGLGEATVVRWLERMDINARRMEFY